MNIIRQGLSIIKKEIKTLLIAFLMALAATVVFGTVAAAHYSNKIQAGIADEVIRFRCLANSNSEEDQLLKLKVRERVLDEINPLIEKSLSKEETKEIILTNMEKIIEAAESEIEENNAGYNAKVSIQNCRFPLKTYGDMTFPAGMYDALVVELGEAEGENFWCVMYPPLCFVDEACEELDERTEKDLRNILTDEEYSIVMNRKNEDKIPEIKFKVVEWWQERK